MTESEEGPNLRAIQKIGCEGEREELGETPKLEQWVDVASQLQ